MTHETVICSVIVGKAGHTVDKGVAVAIAIHSILNMLPFFATGDSCLSHLT